MTAVLFGFMSVTAAMLAIVNCVTLARRVRELERAMAVLSTTREPAKTRLALPKNPSPLHGLRIAIAIRQDHPHPVFANLLREQLLKEDVAEVVLVEPGQEHNEADIFVTGEITCNGYAEVYYRAELTASARKEAICTLVEKPPDGDRPGNLAIEFMALLNAKLDTLISRNERRRALRELGLG